MNAPPDGFFNHTESPTKDQNRAAKQYADARERHERMESELARAMNRWAKSRAALKRAEKRADKLFAVQS
jgi:hypothetical protein